MTSQQIQFLIKSDFFIDNYGPAQLVETHISWVLLARDFVFKVKKPHHFSFLDFSTVSLRKYFCERELELNKRLAKNMYMDVVPIWENNGEIKIEEKGGEVIDYAVKMKRMDETRQMNLLLQKGEVTNLHLDQLAQQLATFHKKAERVNATPNKESMQADFADILSVKDFVGKAIGEKEEQTIKDAVGFSKIFLNTHFDRIIERHQQGFVIDGHGDLYSQNIFLPKNDEPVIFDCIEFSDHFRQLDVLNELGFFCMDLDYYGKGDLASYFLEKYNEQNRCLFNEEDYNLFNYYKLYRANVRAKVGALKAMQMDDQMKLKKQLDFVKEYLDLMEKYMESLSRVKIN